MLRADQTGALAAWRHLRHSHLEVSGDKGAAAAVVVAALGALAPDAVLTGHRAAAVFAGAHPGPVVTIRAEMDALPSPEMPGPLHGAQVPGVSHLCGHDAHMAIKLGGAQGG